MKLKNLFIFLTFSFGLFEVNAQTPYRTWVNRYNGPGNGWDEVKDMAVDNSGNVIVTGGTERTPGNFDFESTTIKYSAGGSMLWLRKYNTTYTAEGNAIITDATGNVYVTGYVAGVYSNCLTIKYGPSGDELWAREYSGGFFSQNGGNAIALDSYGNVYVTGIGPQDGNVNIFDIQTLIYDASGNLIWAWKYNGYGGDDGGVKIKVDPLSSGQHPDFYVAGYSRNASGNFDIVLIKYRYTSPYVVWVKRYNGGGDGYDWPYGMAADGLGNIYIVGESQDYEIPPGGESGGQNTFVTLKWDPDPGHPNPLWVKKYFGSGSNRDASGQSIALSGNSYVYVTGYAREYSAYPENRDYVTIKYSASGSQQWLRRYDYPNGNGRDFAYSLDVSPGYVYVTGTSEEIAGTSIRKIATICYDESGNQKWVNRYGYQYGPPADEGHVVKVRGGSTYVSGISWYNNWDYVTMKVSFVWPDIVSGSNENLNSVSLPTADTGYAVGTNGTILFSSNGGLSWSSQLSGTANTLNCVGFVNSVTGTAVGNGGMVLHYFGAGDEWVAQPSGTTADLYGVYFVTSETGVAVGADGTIIHTRDGGESWESQSSGSTSTLNSVFFIDQGTGFAAGNDGTILHTEDAGGTWVSQTSGTTNNLKGIYFVTDSVGFAVGEYGTVLRTFDGGNLWSGVSPGDLTNFTSVYFLDKEIGVIAGDNGTILATTDAGSSWGADTTNAANNLKGLSFADDNTGIAVGDGGAVFLTTLGEIFYDDGDRGSSVMKLNPISQVPNRFALRQNYPNPFNPKTQIEYQVRKAGLVKLSVYDALGRLVSELVNEVKDVGNYTVEFDGSNLSSGIYFYRLEAGDFISAKKMILAK